MYGIHNAFAYSRYSFTLLDTVLFNGGLKIMLNQINIYYSSTTWENCHEMKYITRCIPPCLVIGKQFLY